MLISCINTPSSFDERLELSDNLGRKLEGPKMLSEGLNDLPHAFPRRFDKEQEKNRTTVRSPQPHTNDATSSTDHQERLQPPP